MAESNLPDDDIRHAIQQFRAGEMGVIALSRILSSELHAVGDDRPELFAALRVFTAIASETDALPIGPLRAMWHPSTAATEDLKVEQAERTWASEAHCACDRITRLLG